MEFTIDKLDNAIKYYLSTEPNTPHSVNKIWGEMVEICPNLHNKSEITMNKIKFNTLCRTLDLENTSIEKMYNKGLLYLMFRTRDNVKVIDNKDYKQVQFEDDNVTSLDMVRYMIKSKNVLSDATLNSNFDEHNNTPIHILCKHNDYNMLGYVMDTYDVDYNKKNKFGETYLDIAVKNKSVKCVTLLLEHKYIDQINAVNRKNIELEKLVAEQIKYKKWFKILVGSILSYIMLYGYMRIN